MVKPACPMKSRILKGNIVNRSLTAGRRSRLVRRVRQESAMTVCRPHHLRQHQLLRLGNGAIDAGEPSHTILTAAKEGAFATVTGTGDGEEGHKVVLMHEIIADRSAPGSTRNARLVFYDPSSPEAELNAPPLVIMATDKPGAAQDLRVTVTFYDLKGAIVCQKEEVLAPGSHQKQTIPG
jgi:hypothetical protein